MRKRLTTLLTIILFIALTGIGFALDSSKVYLLLAIDTGGSDNVGATVVADGVNIREVFEKNIPSHRLAVQNIAESGLSEQKILNVIKNTSAGKDDTVILYYSGHGAFDEQQGHFFHLQNGTNPLRSTFLKALKAKNARLTVLISDCCNMQAKLPAPKSGSGGLMEASGSGTLSPLFKTLFFDAEGIADITAAKAGQCSFIYGRSDKRGSIFTWVFCQELFAEKDSQKSWNSIFKTTAEKSNREFIRTSPNGEKIDIPSPPYYVIQRVMNPYAWTLPKDETGNATGGAVPGTRKRLGVRAENTPFEDGVKIIDVLPGSAGERAKLYIGDTIIEINGQAVRNEDDYVRAVKSSPATLEIKVRTRSGEIKSGTAVLE
ncbi:hypothetical protein FACS189454_08950 [Planctomycetales bacterium]|nr:hypothetical protein FACS189454_08950 [Planctomycetales bacterium]